MSRKIVMFLAIALLAVLVACNQDAEDETDGLKTLEVDFELPETAEVGEDVELKATVTFGEELVVDADEVIFEYWPQGNEEASTKVDSKNNEDGTYTANVSFDQDGVYEIYAHTTARELHTMPKKSITIGDAESMNHEHHGEEDAEGHADTAGFSLHFMEPEAVEVDEEIELTVHATLDNEALEEANVRYEIKNEELAINDWVDTTETVPGEYTTTYSFSEPGNYTIAIHVENEDGLHEHVEKQVKVN